MIIGLGPDYNYPGVYERWRKNNTRYASNHGAAFINRAISRQFDAEFVDDFSNIAQLNRTYEMCFVALASHVSCWRDLTPYAEVVERLDMPVVAPSLGVQDYSGHVSEISELHPSLLRLLSAISKRSSFIGVRGYQTASLLQSAGFENVIPVGCPTFFWNLSPDLTIRKGSLEKSLVVYHRTMSAENLDVLRGSTILGQDFLDHAIFTSDLNSDLHLIELELGKYQELDNFEEILAMLRSNGVFPKTFDEWFSMIGRHTFVFGSRLHGIIAALIQGIPGVLITRDLRTSEMARMFKIPNMPFTEFRNTSVDRLYENADFSNFSSAFRIRYENYLQFLRENKVSHNLRVPDNEVGYQITMDDISLVLGHLNYSRRALEERIRKSSKGQSLGLSGAISRLKQPNHLLGRIVRKFRGR